MVLFDVCDVGVSYGKNEVLKKVSFKVVSGDYIFILGENGAGKSTLLQCMLGLMDIKEGSITQHKQNQCGYLPQKINLQRNLPASVLEVVMSGCKMRLLSPFYTKEHKKHAMNNIERLGLSEIAQKPFRNLSGGQQQRVLLARALSCHGNVLFLDEPVSGLDPSVTADMYQIISGLNKSGITVISTSHDIRAAMTYATKILHLGNDNMFFGSAEEYIKSGTGYSPN